MIREGDEGRGAHWELEGNPASGPAACEAWRIPAVKRETCQRVLSASKPTRQLGCMERAPLERGPNAGCHVLYSMIHHVAPPATLPMHGG